MGMEIGEISALARGHLVEFLQEELEAALIEFENMMEISSNALLARKI